MPRKKSRRRIQRGGSDPGWRDARDGRGAGSGVEQAKVVPSNAKPKKKFRDGLKNIFQKSNNLFKKFTFKDMFLWVLFVVALIIYGWSITRGSIDKEDDYMIVITYSILLTCTLFIGISYYLSNKGGGEDVNSSIMNIFKTMIPLLSSISGLIYIIITYSTNIKTITNIGEHINELPLFNNFIAVMSFSQVSRLIIYFKRMGEQKGRLEKLKDLGLNIFDYVIFTLCFIIQIALTSIISNKLESYRTDG